MSRRDILAGQETQLLSRDVALNDISTRNDWVPGDRGYVANTGRGNIHPVEAGENLIYLGNNKFCLLYTSPSPRDRG